MDYLPLYLSLRGRRCLVVGGGEIALRKLQWLVEADAQVRMVAPDFSPEVQDYATEHGVELVERHYQDGDVQGCMLVIAATDQDAVNRAVFEACEQHNIFVNTVDDQALCTAIFPAIIRRDPVLISVSTGGASPTLARLIRGWIETALPAGLGQLAEFSGRLRDKVRQRFASMGERRQFWEDLAAGPIAQLVYEGREAEAEAQVDTLLASGEFPPLGFVSLVGAGPGDPELLTIRALRCLQQADIVFYDSLVSGGVLELVRRDAIKVNVGKRAGRGSSSRQDDINALLLEHARANERVVRLKGGDPMIFGRAGEEMEALVQADIPFEIIPGVTAALGCAAYAGIPLTHRDWAQSVRFLTARLQDGAVNLAGIRPDAEDETLVIYMGLRSAQPLCQQLIAQGATPELPAAAVVNGTLASQQVIRGTLSTLPALIDEAKPEGPGTLIIGHVVNF